MTITTNDWRQQTVSDPSLAMSNSTQRSTSKSSLDIRSDPTRYPSSPSPPPSICRRSFSKTHSKNILNSQHKHSSSRCDSSDSSDCQQTMSDHSQSSRTKRSAVVPLPSSQDIVMIETPPQSTALSTVRLSPVDSFHSSRARSRSNSDQNLDELEHEYGLDIRQEFDEINHRIDKILHKQRKTYKKLHQFILDNLQSSSSSQENDESSSSNDSDDNRQKHKNKKRAKYH